LPILPSLAELDGLILQASRALALGKLQGEKGDKLDRADSLAERTAGGAEGDAIPLRSPSLARVGSSVLNPVLSPVPTSPFHIKTGTFANSGVEVLPVVRPAQSRRSSTLTL